MYSSWERCSVWINQWYNSNKDDDESIKDKRFLYKLREHYYATDEIKIDYETEADKIDVYRKKYTTWFIQKKQLNHRVT